MLAIKSVLDIFTNINLINNLVCILLESGREYDDFVVLSHCFDELYASWSHKEETVVLILYVMD